MKVSKKIIIEFTLVFIFCLLAMILTNIDIMYLIALVTWFFSIIFSFNYIKDRTILFFFLVTFFIFLLGRDFVQQIFSYKIEIFPRDSEMHAWISYTESLIFILIGYYLFSNSKRNKYVPQDYKSNINKLNIRKISLIIYYILITFAMIHTISISSYVNSTSFTDYYIDYTVNLYINKPLYYISKVSTGMPLAFCIFLGTFPSKKQARSPIIIYALYLILTLGTGHRSTAMLGFFFLIIYYILRNNNNEVWITKKTILLILLIAPFLALFSSYYNLIRENNITNEMKIFEGLVSFFYDQGVSSNTVKHAFTFSDVLPKQIYTLEFAHSGVLARLLGIPVYSGNSIDRALYGGSLSHSLSYTVMRNQYLAGRGTGSSYIAELYYDFGYFGIALGSLLYSKVIAELQELDNNYLLNGYKLFIIPYILRAPRGSFSYFISMSLSPIVIFILICIYLYSNLANYRMNNKE